LCKVVVNEARVSFSSLEGIRGQNIQKKFNLSFHTKYHTFLKGSNHSGDCSRTVLSPDDEFAQNRIVMDRDIKARVNPVVETDPRALR